jgi:hypothetical protein
MFGLVEGDQRILNGDPTLLAKLPQSAGNRFAGGAGHGGHLLVGEQQREAEAASIQVFANLMGQLQQQAPKSRGNGLGQGNAASVLQSKAVFLTDALDGAHLSFFVAAQKGEEAVALDGA